MKKIKNRKGFTTVELVIVIAVIAILAAVLMPTFSNLVKKANESAALQEARNYFTEAYAVDMADGKLDGTTTVAKPSNATSATYGKSGTVATLTYVKGNITVEFDGTTWTVTTGS